MATDDDDDGGDDDGVCARSVQSCREGSSVHDGAPQGAATCARVSRSEHIKPTSKECRAGCARAGVPQDVPDVLESVPKRLSF